MRRFQSHICFKDPDSPLQRTLKGSIRRQVTLAYYTQKINQLYIDVESAWAPVSGAPKEVDLEAGESAKSIVRASLDGVAKIGEIGENEDFFARGIDSLQVLRLVRYLRMQTGLASIQSSTIYLHPSVHSLAQAMHDLAHNTQSSELENEDQRKEDIANALQKFSAKIDKMVPSFSKHTANGQANLSSENRSHTVILTGSTGSIGSYILKAMLEQPNVARVYCLNRSPDSATLQKKRNADMNPVLPTTVPENKVTFLTTDLSEERALGLVPSIYENLQHTVSLIIHNAWRVDFNLPLQSFEPTLAGIVNLAA